MSSKTFVKKFRKIRQKKLVKKFRQQFFSKNFVKFVKEICQKEVGIL